MTSQTCRCGEPTSGAWLCSQCAKTLAYSIANIAAYYDDLGTVSAKRTRYGSQLATKGSIGKSQPLPVDDRFTDTVGDGTQLRWDAWNTIVAWCRTVMEDQPELIGPACSDCLHISCSAVRRRRWPRNTLRSMCNYLDRQFRWIMREEWVPVMLDEFLDVERRLSRFVDSKPERWYAGKCSAPNGEANCEAELYAIAERGDIKCRTCGTTHDIASRRDFLLDEAKTYLVTATEAAGALLAWTDYDGSETKLVDRIRKWRDRSRLETHGQVEIGGKDRDLYRLGDIQALMIEHAQNEQERRMKSPA